jgi:hypothetical protein
VASLWRAGAVASTLISQAAGVQGLVLGDLPVSVIPFVGAPEVGAAAGVSAVFTAGPGVAYAGAAGYGIGTLVNWGLDQWVFGGQGLGGWIYDQLPE